jgi:tRNA G18 (ribose-2'-O)-methylase SpoU
VPDRASLCEDRPVPVFPVSDPLDDRLSDYLSLTDVVLRSRHEPEKGIYIAESASVIQRALEAGHRPRSILMAHRWLEPLADLLAKSDAGPTGSVPVYLADAEVLNAVAGFNVHRGALASMRRPALPAVADLLTTLGPGSCRIVLLEDIVDHTNVGAIFRSVAALGADAVLVSPRCADPLYRRSVRVSMGTVFQVPWTRMLDWKSAASALKQSGFTIAALALSDDSVTLDEFVRNAPTRLALALGAEGDGLSAFAVEEADVAVRIPMQGGVDSLNVAAASAVALWALRPVHD